MIDHAIDRIDRVSWDEFLADWFDWQQGQHVSIIAPTDGGKTVLTMAIQQRRSYVCLFGFKPEDEELSKLTKLRDPSKRFVASEHVPKVPARMPRVLVWPRLKSPNDYTRQRQVIERALLQVWEQGRWCVAVDEMGYVIKRLGLRVLSEQFWEQGRSLGISFLCATQRPRMVPLTMYSSASHLFLGGTNDTEDLKRLSGLNGADTQLVRKVLQRLPTKQTKEFLYVSTRTERMCITRAPYRK